MAPVTTYFSLILRKGMILSVFASLVTLSAQSAGIKTIKANQELNEAVEEEAEEETEEITTEEERSSPIPSPNQVRPSQRAPQPFRELRPGEQREDLFDIEPRPPLQTTSVEG